MDIITCPKCNINNFTIVQCDGKSNIVCLNCGHHACGYDGLDKAITNWKTIAPISSKREVFPVTSCVCPYCGSKRIDLIYLNSKWHLECLACHQRSMSKSLLQPAIEQWQ